MCWEKFCHLCSESLYIRSLNNSDNDKFFISFVLGSTRLDVLEWKRTWTFIHTISLFTKTLPLATALWYGPTDYALKRFIISETISVDRFWSVMFCQWRESESITDVLRSVDKVTRNLLLPNNESTRNCALFIRLLETSHFGTSEVQGI